MFDVEFQVTLVIMFVDNSMLDPGLRKDCKQIPRAGITHHKLGTGAVLCQLGASVAVNQSSISSK